MLDRPESRVQPEPKPVNPVMGQHNFLAFTDQTGNSGRTSRVHRLTHDSESTPMSLTSTDHLRHSPEPATVTFFTPPRLISASHRPGARRAAAMERHGEAHHRRFRTISNGERCSSERLMGVHEQGFRVMRTAAVRQQETRSLLRTGEVGDEP